MIEHPSSSSSPSPVSTQSSNNEVTGSQELKPPTPVSGLEVPSAGSTPGTPTKLKPMRKAPPPPLKIENSTHSNTPESKLPTLIGTKTPKQGRPRVAPPEPPVRGKTSGDNSHDDDTGPLYEPIGQSRLVNGVTASNGSSTEQLPVDNVDIITSDNNGLSKPVKVKPPVPKRYMKPKLVTVPRAEVKLPDLRRSMGEGELMKLRSPPPSRPVAPKLGPIRAKLVAPKPLMDESMEEDDLTFQVNSQRKFDAILKQNSLEQDSTSPESPPYRSMSSFGATFGKTESAPKPVARTSTFSVPQPQKVPAPVAKEPERIPSPVKPTEPLTQEPARTPTPDLVGKTGNEDTPDTPKTDAFNTNVPIIDSGTTDKAHKDDTPTDNVTNAEKPKPKSSIPLTPTMKVSKLQPPKHSAASIKGETPSAKVEAKENDDTAMVTTPTEKVSKLPKSKVEPVSKIPTVGQQAKPEVDQNVFQYPQTNEKDENKDSILDTKPDSQVEEPSDTRPRTESIGKPPVAPKPKSNLPKVLPKPKPVLKTLDVNNKENIKAPNTVENDVKESSDSIVVPASSPSENKDSKPRITSESESEAKPQSKIPLNSVIAQKTPPSKVKKSGIPSSGLRKPSIDRAKDSDPEAESPTAPAPRTRLESPQMPRKQSNKSPKPGEHTSLRNRSNSPANRTGIPKSMRNRSNSPAKPTGIPLPGSAGNKSTPKQKRSGLVAPKKIVNGQGKQSPVEPEAPLPTDEGTSSPQKDESFEQPSPAQNRPSRSPAISKQPSQDGKPPKAGKSLLPLIHKSLEAGVTSPNGVTSGNKQKRSIPVPKSTRPPPPADDSQR